jgi:hypothetical protein
LCFEIQQGIEYIPWQFINHPLQLGPFKESILILIEILSCTADYVIAIWTVGIDNNRIGISTFSLHGAFSVLCADHGHHKDECQ